MENLSESLAVKTPGFSKAILPKIIPICKNKKIINALTTHINMYIDKNSEILYDIGPTKQLVFSDADKDFLFDTTGIDRVTVKEDLKQTRVIDKKWVITNDPFNLLATSIIYGLNSEKDDKNSRQIMYFLGLKLYTSKFYRSFNYEPNYNIMKYTVNNLSEKYKLKQKGNLFDALIDFMDTAFDTYVKDVNTLDDKILVTFLNGLDTRIGSFVKGIATEFYPNAENNKYMNADTEVKTDDTYLTNDNHMYVIGRASDTVSTKLATTGIDYKIIQLAARVNGVSEISLRNAIEQIDRDHNQEAIEFTKNIITMYVSENPSAKDSDIGTNLFTATSMDLYKRNNTVDPVLLAIKETINRWIDATSVKYSKSNRVATINNFRRAIYTYYVYYITKNVK
ncbi:MAG: hypothetical protein ACRC0G_07335 [Fusobacteriaceae bacterium]